MSRASLWSLFLTTLLQTGSAFVSVCSSTASFSVASCSLTMSATTSAATIPSWSTLQEEMAQTAVGQALNQEVELRKTGQGSAHVQNTLRYFGKTHSSQVPNITLFRDHAGWCPYCQKTMLLIEEKEIPVRIELVPMRSYGDKPVEFLQKVPSGLLPAIQLQDSGQVITESQVIMELLDEWHTVEDGYKPMMPITDKDKVRYQSLARLERELFSWWCTLVFRPEGPRLGGGGGNLLEKVFGGPSSKVSGAMRGFLECLQQVDDELRATPSPWFFDRDHPTMIDFIYVSHVERMLASVAYWKGLDLRNAKQWKLAGLNRWLEAFEKREAYLAFKSDYYTHVMDIPPQYGPGYDGGFEEDRRSMSNMISGRDHSSWRLPLSHDDPLQPLYHGPPLPVCVLEAAGLMPDTDGSYYHCDVAIMEMACRHMAAWKLSGNGPNVATFASRGGPKGSKNARKTFGAPLADPYANADDTVKDNVDAVLRIVCQALKEEAHSDVAAVKHAISSTSNVQGVVESLAYLRDRVGVPRDLPLAAARYLRAYLNWAIEALTS